VPGTRRLSQRISEGDGIAIIVAVGDADAARAAEAQGAKAVAVEDAIPGIRAATALPILWIGAAAAVEADAVTVRPGDEVEGDELEHVVVVSDEDELAHALERRDPEILLLSPRDDAHDDLLEAILELLPDVPAGKLAIANVEVTTRDEVLALERAGIDAVLVRSTSLAELVGA
jgi:DNA-binding NarL/FixJ family response regulator